MSISLGMVLSGGAARGAYEAGVLRFLFGELARRVGRPTWPDVVSGTSVGALNGVFAATRDTAELARLSEIWQRLRISDVYRLRPGQALVDLLSSARRRGFAVLDPSPFKKLLERTYPRSALRQAIASRATRAFIVSATEVATGFNALFVDSAEAITIPTQPGARAYRTAVEDDHCRASAAIPFMFPAVAIDGRYHVDGGLRQNTPLRPALATGVDRALIVSVKQAREVEAVERVIQRVEADSAGSAAAARRDARPSLMFLAGKMLNALMLDPIERDLWNAEYRNRIVGWGSERYGADFAEAAEGALGLRHVDIVHVTPSEDLGRMAGDIYRAEPPPATRVVRFLLDKIADYTFDAEADFLSYLFFDRAYTGALEALGFEDARRREDDLARLYEPEVTS